MLLRVSPLGAGVACWAQDDTGSRHATGLHDGRVVLYTASDGGWAPELAEADALAAHARPVTALAWGPPELGCGLLASASAGGVVLHAPGRPARRVLARPAAGVAYSPACRGPLLAVSTAGRVLLLNTESGEEVESFTAAGAGALVWAPSAAVAALAVAAADGVALWCCNPAGVWRRAASVPGDGSCVAALAWSPSGLLAVARGRSVALWTVRTGTDGAVALEPGGGPLQHAAPVRGLDFNAAGTALATASGEGVRLWGLGLGRELTEQGRFACA